MWGWIVTGALAAGGVVWYRWSDAKEKKRKVEAAESARREAQRAAHELREKATAARAKLAQDILVDNLIIDSNIWMNEKYDSFFLLLTDVIAQANRPVVLYGPQFDEICNIKRSTSFEETKSKRARLAINRIEQLQKQNLLRVEPITMDSQRGAYADPVSLKLLIALNKNPRTVTFVSDDKELRIRARELVRSGQGVTKIIDIGELREDIESYSFARARNFV